MPGGIYSFGAGVLVGSVVDSAGVRQSYRFGTLQGIDLTIEATQKELFGELQSAVDTARGTAKYTATAKVGKIQGDMLAMLYFNETAVTGHDRLIPAETGTPSTNTYTALNAGTPWKDLGVRSAVNGQRYKRVASAPTAGQYSVVEATAVYTFAAGDANAVTVIVTYVYRASGGQRFVINNQQMGLAPVFEAYLSQARFTKSMLLHMNAGISTKLGMPTKLDDYQIFDFGVSFFGDATDKIGDFNFSDID